MVQWVRWGPEAIPTQEGPYLPPLGEVPIKVDDGAAVEEENSTMAEQAA